MKSKFVAVGALVAMLLAVFVFVLLLGGSQPTPALAAVGDSYYVSLWAGDTPLTAATSYARTCEAGDFNVVDIYYSAVISGTDTYSLAIQSSPDGSSSTWVTQATLVSGATADTSAAHERLSVLGRCYRAVLTQSDATAVTPVTPTVGLLLRMDAGSGASDIAVVDDFTVGSDLSVVGNTTAGGTLAVTGASTLTGALAANGGITVDSTAFTVADSSGNTSIGGTLGVTGASTLTGLLNANGGIAVDTNAFTVADTSGNTVVGGTLGVTGASTLTGAAALNGGLAMDTDKFTVADDTGNTSIAGTLKVAGATNLVLDATAITTDTVLTAADSGTYIAFKNQDTFSVQVDLPAAAAGLSVCFFNYDGDDVVINPDDADQIVVLTNAAGDSLTNTTAGDSICLVALDATDWMAVPGRTGTWSDGN